MSSTMPSPSQRNLSATSNDNTRNSASSDSDAQPLTKKSSTKSSSACVHCKSLKVRCHFTPGHPRCDRCEDGNHECAPRSRKKRKTAPTQEELQLRSREQDEQINSLLSQFDCLRMEAKVTEWQKRAAATKNVGGLVARLVCPVTCHYYSTLIGPLEVDLSPSNPQYERLPMLLRAGILEPYEVLDLFNLFFERINPFFTLLDGEIHCPQILMWTNHFLFDVVCACASRHYLRRPGLYDVLMDIARDAAAEALVSGEKSVELVQGFLLLSVYPIPQKKWSDNRSWLFMGAAIRLAQELELDKMPTGDNERESFNRIRTWLNCFSVDKSHAAQFGKMHMVSLDDQVVRSAVRIWYKASPMVNAPYDIGLCAYSEMLLLLAKFRHEVGFRDDLNQKFLEGFDVVAHATAFDKHFDELSTWWSATLNADPNYNFCPIIRYRTHNFTLVSSYMRLVVLSVGFQYAVKKGITRECYILQQSIAMARSAILTVIDHLYPSGFLSWALEANFLYMAFSAAFLLNLLRPKFLPLLTVEQCAEIVGLVQALIKILSSNDVAIDGRHSPALYSKFLRSLLEKYRTRTPSLQADINAIASSQPQVSAQYQTQQYPLETYSWPDTTLSNVVAPQALGDKHANMGTSTSYEGHVARQLIGEPDMDFSLTHFVESTRNPSNNTTESSPSPSLPMPAPAYTLEELQQLASTPPGYADTAWMRPFFGNM
ncbi:hypothetical protein BDY19DRAFT_260419 [Irpex rosettiformis]|uniref:Uncharacterized protein n=1 Tax=Irpex rosettiformis TaxID=378272 RepID=A0ACB8UH46_9APHY|nr:hypothetical protein BDY19DRAFT_260419 [Irpex rosettiformis]